jgi:hypothetical protein
MNRIFGLLSKGVSLGCDAWFASMIYVGLGLLALALMPELPNVLSQSYCDCPEGQISVTVGEGCECQCPPTSE